MHTSERFVRSIKQECLERMVLLGEHHLRMVVREYVAHYQQERNHQGLDNELIVALRGGAGAEGGVASANCVK